MIMSKFESEWAIEERLSGSTTLYLGHSKEWCVFNCCGNNEIILQNVQVTQEEGVLKYKGTARELRFFWDYRKYFNLSIVDDIEINPSQYKVKKTWFKKKAYLQIDFGRYLYKEPRGIRNVITSNFKVCCAGA